MKAYLDPEDVMLMEGQATCVRDHLLIRMLFRLGCRISEALGIRVEDVDFTRGTVTIVHLKSRLRVYCPGCQARLGKSHRFCPGCGMQVADPQSKAQEVRKQRSLPLDPDTLAMLDDFIRRDATTGLVFRVNRHRAWQIVKTCGERAGLPVLTNPETGKVRNVSPHRLRDAFAVHAVKQDDTGDGLRLLQEHLGHASFNTTARYRKVAGEELREWYEKLWDVNGKDEGAG
ncbi:MAG: tyrosine-type recombinase/integrase [Chloroflexi bacterium]|nr:tyrosine-type recombinase/integrase [Chloroflexota bacterium]